MVISKNGELFLFWFSPDVGRHGLFLLFQALHGLLHFLDLVPHSRLHHPVPISRKGQHPSTDTPSSYTDTMQRKVSHKNCSRHPSGLLQALITMFYVSASLFNTVRDQLNGQFLAKAACTENCICLHWRTHFPLFLASDSFRLCSLFCNVFMSSWILNSYTNVQVYVSTYKTNECY